MAVDDIRLVVDSYFQIQKLRVQVGNRLNAVERKTDEPNIYIDFLQKMANNLNSLEKECIKIAKEYVKDHPAWNWLKRVKGIGVVYTAKLLSYIDIEKADTVSALWRYAGLGVVDGKAEKKVKGEKLHFNNRLKSTMYLIGSSFLKSKGKFSQIYYQEKERQEREHPELSKGQIHYRALRKMNKIFLACLWEYWRQAEGLPVRKFYVEEVLGHTSIYHPEDFIEKE